jgi:hypothetical protein
VRDPLRVDEHPREPGAAVVRRESLRPCRTEPLARRVVTDPGRTAADAILGRR